MGHCGGSFLSLGEEGGQGQGKLPGEGKFCFKG